mgnify:CR=1 FL=1
MLALRIGLTYDEYWAGEPEMMVPYAELYKQQIRTDFLEKDTLAWLIGSYVCTAIGMNFNAAFGKKGSQNKIKYPDKPMFIDEFDEKARQKKQEREVMRSYNNFLAAVQASNFEIIKAASE